MCLPRIVMGQEPWLFQCDFDDKARSKQWLPPYRWGAVVKNRDRDGSLGGALGIADLGR